MISKNTVQQIISRLEILDIVGGFVKLKRRGTNYLGLCPFHNEKSPSFTVSPSKEIFKCFGCGKSGNSISFIMEHEKLSYVEALRWLAAKYNIQIEETAVSPQQRLQVQTSESLFIINQFAQKFFSEQLFETENGNDIALSYMKERGFTEDVLRKFGVGYSPDSRDLFTKKAIAAQFNQELLQKSGLVVLRNEQFQDNYRDRIIFPVHNHIGKIIGFGARLIKKNDKAPKYINTPENELYVKSKILYGTYFAKQAIDKLDECLLVEGYTDVISLHQSGIENVVASGGTSLTSDQLRLIKKYTKNLTIIFDGDSAGIKAALRGLDMAIEEGLNVKLLLIPDNEDPDSFIKKYGSKVFLKFIQTNKQDFIIFKLEALRKEFRNDVSKKGEIVEQIAQTISKIDKVEDFTKQQDYIRTISGQLQIDEGGFTDLVNKYIRNRLASNENKLPIKELENFAENSKKGEQSDFSDQSFELIFRDECQEKEVARVLIEFGEKPYNSNETVAQHIINIKPDDELFQNTGVLKIINEYSEHLKRGSFPDKTFFIYHPDLEISALVVSLFEIKYQESERWKRELSSSTGYQPTLTQQSYEEYMSAIKNPELLSKFLNLSKDNSHEQVHSAALYLNLKKVIHLISQHTLDFEKENPTQEQLKSKEIYEGMKNYILTQMALKEIEKKTINGNGTVIMHTWKK